MDISDLLVLLKQLQESQAITGEVRPFVITDIERNYNLNLDWDWNVRKKLETEYNNAPVLIADSVYP
jgi:hypothetical protein